MSPRRNWDSPTPSLASECATPPRAKRGRGHIRLRARGWERPNSDWRKSLLSAYSVRSPKFIWALCAQLYSLTETPQPKDYKTTPNPHYPRIWAQIRGRYWSTKQDRRHLFVNPRPAPSPHHSFFLFGICNIMTDYATENGLQQ
jgi:hypothetical protein